MEKLNKKYNDLSTALLTLHVALENFEKVLKKNNFDDISHKELVDAFRDSLIQRFEYCFELTWKYVALYLETKLEVVAEMHAPSFIFRKACQVRLISEQESDIALQMVKDRNKTSHIYKAEIADYIAASA